MLSPIPHHHPAAHTDEGQDEHEQRRARVQPRHRHHERIARQLRQDGLDEQPVPPLAHEVQRELDGDEEEEAEDVQREMEDGVALVADGGGQVVRAVPLAVVVLDVVVVIRVPGVAHEWLEHVRDGPVEESVSLCEDPAVMDVVVQHYGEGAGVVGGHREVG